MNASTTLPALVLGMRSDEWATALYASDMPTRRGEHSPDQIAAWIVQGVERLGGEVATWQRSQDFLKVLDIRDNARYEAERRRLFPKPRRHDRARGAAYGLCLDLEKAGVRRHFPTVRVFLPVDELGDLYSVEVPARDVEMRRRIAVERAGRAA
ncbi:hypothetical protein [Streptosporangium sp. NPDC006007]|uniref:hypothetical protein n=1 Tax=Streptosporangium sp. NPDC006007 TaxID=3154575 RepID=UPI0033A8FF4B